MDYGLWTLDFWLLSLCTTDFGLGLWTSKLGIWITDFRLRTFDNGLRTLIVTRQMQLVLFALQNSLKTNLVTRFEHHICMLSQFPTTRRRFGIRYTPIMLCVNTEDPNEEMNCTHTEYYCVIAQCVSDKIHTYIVDRVGYIFLYCVVVMA